MDITDMQERWNTTLVDIFGKLIDICKTYNLRYYCCGGTAIGAVRHKGMIPWDDDIDIMMPRPDYDRLIEIAKTADWGNYELITPYNNDTYPLYFSKLSDKRTTLIEYPNIPCVLGLYVDIFPLDGSADTLDEARNLKDKFVKTINRLSAISTRTTFSEHISLLKHKNTLGRFAIKTLAWFCRPAVRRHLIKKMDKLSHIYDYEKSKYVALHTGSYSYKEILPKEWLEEGSIHTFEHIEVILPKQYDAYLRQVFGNYMQLPPEDKRTAHHEKAYLNMDGKEKIEDIRRKVHIAR